MPQIGLIRPTRRHRRRSATTRIPRSSATGTIKLIDIDIDIAERKLRLPRGRVAQTILIAIQLTIANLRQIDVWKRDHGSSAEDEGRPDSETPETAGGERDQAHPELRLRPPD